jgi:hypothetical protein
MSDGDESHRAMLDASTSSSALRSADLKGFVVKSPPLLYAVVTMDGIHFKIRANN